MTRGLKFGLLDWWHLNFQGHLEVVERYAVDPLRYLLYDYLF